MIRFMDFRGFPHGCNRPWLYIGADRIVSSRVWHGLTWFDILFFTGPCRSIESQHDCEEHRLVMELHWHWRRRARFAFCRFTFRYVKVNFSWKNVGSSFKVFFYFQPYLGKISNLTNIFQKIRYCLILFNTCMEYLSSFTSCRLHPLSPTSVLLPSHVRDSWKISNINSTPWFHFDYMIFRNLEPQTIVPNIRLCTFSTDVVPWQVDFILLTFNAAARAWGRTTMAKPFQSWDFIMRSASII